MLSYSLEENKAYARRILMAQSQEEQESCLLGKNLWQGVRTPQGELDEHIQSCRVCEEDLAYLWSNYQVVNSGAKMLRGIPDGITDKQEFLHTLLLAQAHDSELSEHWGAQLDLKLATPEVLEALKRSFRHIHLALRLQQDSFPSVVLREQVELILYSYQRLYDLLGHNVFLELTGNPENFIGDPDKSAGNPLDKAKKDWEIALHLQEPPLPSSP